MRVFLLCLSAWLLPIGLPALPVSHAADEVDDLLAVLVEQKDAADTELIRQLAALQSEMAFEGLLSIYSEMGSVYMRRAVLRAMASFDGNAALENKAAAKIRDVATLSESRQMRMIALEILATCRSVGKPHLASIVRSSADDELREIALRRHASLADETDLDWYRELYTGIQADQEAPRKLKKAERIRAAKKLEKEQDQASNREPHQLQVLREIAFERLLSSHSLPELQKACDERNLEIRLMAMRELEQRGPEQAFEVARRTYMNARRPAGERLLAAQIIKHAAA